MRLLAASVNLYNREMVADLPYSKAFFDLQIRFARRVSDLAKVPLGQAFLDYTNFYIRLGLGRDFDPKQPIWAEFANGLASAPDPAEWAQSYVQSHGTRPSVPLLVATFGCFAYANSSAGRLRLHFENIDPPDVAPLGEDRYDTRREELRALLTHVQRTQPSAERLAGVSWLYNLPAYRRLFPETYLASAAVAPHRFRNMPLWGQFLDRNREVRPAAAALFLERLARQRNMSDLTSCFPLQPFAVEAPLDDFYAFFGL